jgi:hypothetical protein
LPWGEIGLHSLALAAYPGAVTLLLLGALAEWAAAWALLPESGGLLAAGRKLLVGLRPAGRARGLPALATAAALLTLLAATQAAFPLNPVPAGERNLLVAAIALASAGWAAWAWGWDRPELNPRLVLAVQAAWLVAVFAPAVVPENLRPEALGAVLVNKLLPLKVACGLLYLLCLPVLIQLLPEAAPQGLPAASGRPAAELDAAGFAVVRVMLWLPYCALFASLFFPPASDDPQGLLRFLGLTAGGAAIAIAVAGVLVRRGPATRAHVYGWIVVPFAWITVGLAMLTAALR